MRNPLVRLRTFAQLVARSPTLHHIKAYFIRAAYRLRLLRRLPFQYPFWQILWRHAYAPHLQYLWGTLCAAAVAKELGLPRISVIEFGVAGGTGLVRLEQFARYVESVSGVGIDVYGFDSGQGLPKPVDYRDLPQLWSKGHFSIDLARLQSRLSGAKLLIGQVADTVPQFMEARPAPIGFVAFDLDLYHSTMDAFAIFRGSPGLLLPRVVCYFDDIVAFSHSDYTGERLAISDFNRAGETRKISPIYGLRDFLGVQQGWVEMMFMMHAFDHPQYCDFDGTHRLTELPLRG